MIDDLFDSIPTAPTHKRAWWWVCRKTDSVFRFPSRLFRKIRGGIQRARRGYSDYDLIDLDMYLAGVIYKSVLHLRDTSPSRPTDMSVVEWYDVQSDIGHGFASYFFGDDGDIEESLELFVKYFRHLWS